MNGIAVRATFRGRDLWSLPALPALASHDPSEPSISFLFGFKGANRP